MFSCILNKSAAFIIVALVGISGCAAGKETAGPQGFLATHIFVDGSKQFVYTTELPNPVPGGKGGGRPGNVTGQLSGSSNRGLSGGVTAGTGYRRPGSSAGRPGRSRDEMLVSAVEKELEKSGFCRNGYKELDRMTEPRQTYLKGECIDAANAHDRRQFPNS